jgi:hypothetical protein
MQLEQYHATLLRAGVTFDPGLSAEEVQEVERRWQFRIYTTFRTPHYNVGRSQIYPILVESGRAERGMMA